MAFFGGIEGGGTSTVAVLLNIDGDVIARASSDKSTNHWLVGYDSCATVIISLMSECRKSAGHATDAPPLTALGLTLSGMGFKEEEEKLIAALTKAKPDLSKDYHICEDTDGALATAAPNGGVVIISGTGSNCVLWEPNETESPHRNAEERVRVGGWGHMLGDKGGAYYIASRAIQTVFRLMDGELLEGEKQSDCEWLHAAMMEYFKIETRRDVLPFFYSTFEKSRVARFCIEVAEGARQGDALCAKLMKKAGFKLGRALASALSQSRREGHVSVVCVGNVFKSFDLLAPGLHEALAGVTRDVTFVKLIETCAIGAASLASGGVVKIDTAKTTVTMGD